MTKLLPIYIPLNQMKLSKTLFTELVLRPALHRPGQPGGLAGHGQEDPEAEGQHERRRQQPQVPVQVQVLPGERRRRGHPRCHTEAPLQAGIVDRCQDISATGCVRYVDK